MAKSYHHLSAKSDYGFGALVVLAAIYWTHKTRLSAVANYIRNPLPYLLLLAAIMLASCLVVTAQRHLRLPSGAQARSKIAGMSGLAFEKFVAGRLTQHGYSQVHLTEHYDLGVDITAMKTATNGVYKLNAIADESRRTPSGRW